MLTAQDFIKLPITSWAIGVVFFRISETGVVEFANQRYTDTKRGGQVSTRLPLGTKEDIDERVLDTLYREAREEMAKHPDRFDLELLDGFPVYAKLGEDYERAGGVHLKAFFAAVAKGELRDFEKHDDGDILGPIVFTEASELINRGPQGIPVFRTHLPAILKTLSLLARLREVEDQYHLFLKRTNHLIPPDFTREERAKIEACLRR
ncbi:hypothetical protein EPN83_01825 [Patescibacteria group bacterium]|nr:MAG: hypothetical protein EPN83_01825 [Patescibacteria group bacterium]